MNGNTGKIVNVDLTAGKATVEILPEEYYRKYIGGSGLAAKLFWERGDFKADPLSPEAMLLFMNGPFAGLRLSGASRNSVAGCSPLTGHWGDSSCGGFFAPELRYAGFDGMILTGKAAQPSVLLMVDDKVTLEDGSAYWGKGTEEVTEGAEGEVRQGLPDAGYRAGSGKSCPLHNDLKRRAPCDGTGRLRRRYGGEEPQGHRDQGDEKGDDARRSGSF